MKLIVARNVLDGIGLNGKLPWKCPEDLKWFKEFTTGKTIVMGRTTFEGVGRLPNRTTLVLSRTQTGEGFINSLYNAPADAIIVGGESVYEEALRLNLVDEMYITEIDNTVACDTFFNYNWNKWRVSFHKELSKNAKVYKHRGE